MGGAGGAAAPMGIWGGVYFSPGLSKTEVSLQKTMVMKTPQTMVRMPQA